MIQLAEILKLSVADRMSLIEEIWNSIDHQNLSVTEAHKKELDNRLKRLAEGKTKFTTWEEVKRNLPFSKK